MAKRKTKKSAKAKTTKRKTTTRRRRSDNPMEIDRVTTLI